jgi:hypothetical protein
MTIPRLFALAAAIAALLLLPGGAIATDDVRPFSGTVGWGNEGRTPVRPSQSAGRLSSAACVRP